MHTVPKNGLNKSPFPLMPITCFTLSLPHGENLDGGGGKMCLWFAGFMLYKWDKLHVLLFYTHMRHVLETVVPTNS